MSEIVSVIVPAYNTEKYISKCITSLVGQSYKEIEIILINDGSIDGTLSVCRKFEKEDKRIRVIDKGNSGVSDSRNIGLKESVGKYVVFVDSDDYVSMDYISTLVLAVEENDYQMACVEYFFVDEDENKEEKHKSILEIGENKELKSNEAIDLMINKNSYQGYLWNKIFIRDILAKNNILFDVRVKIWEDMLFCLEYLLTVDSINYINVPLYYYVQRSSSAMGSQTDWNENTHILALDEIWRLISDKPGIFHNYIRDYYANDLAGMLGKDRLREKINIKKIIDKIERLDANLTIKHKLKMLIYKVSMQIY